MAQGWSIAYKTHKGICFDKDGCLKQDEYEMRNQWIKQMAKNRISRGVKNSKLILQEMFIYWIEGRDKIKDAIQILDY